MYSVYHIFSIFHSCSIFQEKNALLKNYCNIWRWYAGSAESNKLPQKFKIWSALNNEICVLLLFDNIYVVVFYFFWKKGVVLPCYLFILLFCDFFLILSISNDIHILSFLNNCNLRLLNAILNLEHIIF